MAIPRGPANGIALAGVLSVLAWTALGPSLAAEPAAQPGATSTTTAPAGVIVEGPSGSSVVAMPDDPALARAAVPLTVEHGGRQARYEGPLLWSLLEHAGDVGKPGEQVRRTVLVTGRDGYTAVLALGEISPEFGGRPVILADRMDGEPLGPDHLRLVVPGEKRGGRSVRDVVRISVRAVAPGAH